MQTRLNPSLIPLCARQKVVPVLTITDLATAVPLARALVAGGLTLLEITLRTPVAAKAIRHIAAEVAGAEVGAGTVLSRAQAEDAVAEGARFLVSPGATPRLLDAADALSVPVLPGAATGSEIMALLERGYHFMKFFPAEQSGGVGALKAFAAPFGDAKFCPTGGVGTQNLGAYLDCPNVVCVGGSWVAPANLISAGDWAAITRLARAASTFGDRTT